MDAKSTETSRSITKNVFYGFSTWLLPLVLGFVTTPVLVGALGQKDYGIYALVLGFIAYSFNFNIGRAATKYIAEYRASGAREKIGEVVSATVFLNLAVGLAGLALIWLAAEWLTADVFRIEGTDQTKTVAALRVAGLIIFFVMLNQVFNAVLQGIQRFDVYSKIFNVGNFLLLGGNLVLALGGFGLMALLWWNLAVTVSLCLVFFAAARRLLPEFEISLRFGAQTLKAVVGFSWAVIGCQILGNLVLLFERSWITRQLGPENLTVYVIPMMLALYIHGFVASLTMVIFPLASELRDEKEKLLRLYQKATKIVAFVTVFPALTLIVASRPFLTLWLGADLAAQSAGLLVIHTVTFSLMAIGVVAFQVTEGRGYPQYNFVILFLCLVISLGGMVLLTPEYGNTGIALSRLLGFMTIFWSIFYVERWFFGKIQLKFWLRLILWLAPAAALSAAWEQFLVHSLPVGWLALGLAVVSGGLVYTGVLWLLGFVTAEEKLLARRLLGR